MAKQLNASGGKALLVFIISISIGVAFLANMLIPQLVAYNTATADVDDPGTLAMLLMVGVSIAAGIIIVILKGAGLF